MKAYLKSHRLPESVTSSAQLSTINTKRVNFIRGGSAMGTAEKEKKNVAKGFQPLGERVFVTYTE
jgi:hypothetical protein